MEMRWEKLYSGGLAEFHKSESGACRAARRASALDAVWLGALLTVLIIGSALLFN
ncbi:hypothetical protein [Cupriavidus consociatus]|uniref:hypothetical protein n=1 Tax=Cupriavidus consociatus TaxID=2821357 RepID=UPI001AEABB70|nr:MULTISPECIES: hypothetical protein [unclassified Cupriavidus]MBP0619349.1 hypothetical protein [Cupriavidus sp. LEh25]MDK2655997.1 hypothetical protein [Cupriavidus sp. LEh21]